MSSSDDEEKNQKKKSGGDGGGENATSSLYRWAQTAERAIGLLLVGWIVYELVSFSNSPGGKGFAELIGAVGAFAMWLAKNPSLVATWISLIIIFPGLSALVGVSFKGAKGIMETMGKYKTNGSKARKELLEKLKKAGFEEEKRNEIADYIERASAKQATSEVIEKVTKSDQRTRLEEQMRRDAAEALRTASTNYWDERTDLSEEERAERKAESDRIAEKYIESLYREA